MDTCSYFAVFFSMVFSCHSIKMANSGCSFLGFYDRMKMRNAIHRNACTGRSKIWTWKMNEFESSTAKHRIYSHFKIFYFLLKMNWHSIEFDKRIDIVRRTEKWIVMDFSGKNRFHCNCQQMEYENQLALHLYWTLNMITMVWPLVCHYGYL